MLASLTIIGMQRAVAFAATAPLLAQSGPSPSVQWAIVLFPVILGLLVTLSPSRRTFEIKRSKDE